MTSLTTTSARRSVLLGVLLCASVSCAGPSAFGLVSDDSSQAQLSAVLAAHPSASAPQIHNTTGSAMVVVTGGTPKFLAAYDLTEQKLRWRVAADVTSRIAIGNDYVVAMEGKMLVARELATGAVRWLARINGSVVGVAASAKAVVAVTQRGGSKPTWQVEGFAARGGSSRWSSDSAGKLGAPVIQADVVLVPFLSQWLNLLDINTGNPLARLRGLEDEVAILRATSDAAYFGSKRGMIRLDDKAAAGRRAESSFVTIKLPPQLGRATWGVDAYSSIESTYSAADRTRLLWRGPARGAFELPHVTVHYFRYLFDYAQDGALRWVYSHPRVELVASEHIGAALLAVAGNGQVVALDPATGGVVQRLDLGLGNVTIAGATFDADGWQPTGTAEVATTRAALVAIAKDRDARFDAVKELAVAALAKETGAEVTAELLGILAEPRVAMKLKDQVVDILVRRKDVSALPAFVDALALHTDFVQGTEAAALGPVARSMAGLVGAKIDAGLAQKAVVALAAHLEDPATSNGDLDNVIDAMSAVGGGREIPALRAHVLAYRGDPDTANDEPWRLAIINALLRGGPPEVELLRSLADDRRTDRKLAQAITAALSKK
ncbi:MAG: PQQ-binding-like beta-propeller repeat protein [Kofleriaceae bacterium]|nr:PQQ-binding-like beta-propeller repeat protein [Kofleriaceae bacterium]